MERLESSKVGKLAAYFTAIFMTVMYPVYKKDINQFASAHKNKAIAAISGHVEKFSRAITGFATKTAEDVSEPPQQCLDTQDYSEVFWDAMDAEDSSIR